MTQSRRSQSKSKTLRFDNQEYAIAYLNLYRLAAGNSGIEDYCLATNRKSCGIEDLSRLAAGSGSTLRTNASPPRSPSRGIEDLSLVTGTPNSKRRKSTLRTATRILQV